MKYLYKKKLLSFIALNILITLLTCDHTIAQTPISPKYSVDGIVNAMVSKGDTLIIGGDFYNAGIYTGGAALLKNDTALPDLQFPKIVGTLNSITPDGKGGFYIYGVYRRESEDLYSTKQRIEHILPDHTFENGFSLSVDALFGVNTILYHDDILYIGGKYIEQIGGQKAGDLCAVNLLTKQLVTWLPTVTRNYLGGISGLYVKNNKLYFIGSFSEVGTVKRKSAGAVEIGTGIVSNWAPSLGEEYTDLKFYKDQIIISGGFGDSIHDNHACALIDTITGQKSLKYLFNSSNLYWAASARKMAIKGDTLFVFSSGTYDTRITAMDLAHENHILWQKYFNMIASVGAMDIINNSLVVVGNFEKIYKTNLDNDDANTEREIKGIVKLNLLSGNLEKWYPDPLSEVYCLSIYGNNILVGGTFTHLAGVKRSGMLILNTKTDEILPCNIDIDFFSKEVTALKLIDSTLYLAGDFSIINGKEYTASVLSMSINSGRLLTWHPPYLGKAWALEANNKYVFIGGILQETSGGKNLFAIDRKTAALASWRPNPDGQISSASLHLFKNNLYVGGRFSTISGQARTYIAAYDTTTLNITDWQPATSLKGGITAITSSESTIWLGNSAGLLSGFDPSSGNKTYSPSDSVVLSGRVNSILTRGRYVIAAGEFLIADRVCNNLMIFDFFTNKLLPATTLCTNFSNTSENLKTITLVKNDLYIGGDFTNLNNRINAPNIERIRFTTDFFDSKTDTTYSFYPTQGGNGGDISITFRGEMIRTGIQVKLTAPGKPDITVPADRITFSREYQMDIKLDLRQKAIGDYNVVITTTDGKDHTTTNGFKVIPFVKANLWVQVLGADAARNRAPSPYLIEIGNRGNCDAVGVPLYLFVSQSATVKFKCKFSALDGSPVDSINYALLDTLFNEPNKVKAYWLLVPRVKAGETKNIQIEVTPMISDTDFVVTAVVNDPLFSSTVPDNRVGNVVHDSVSAYRASDLSDKSECIDAFWSVTRDFIAQSLDILGADYVSCINGGTKIFKTVVESVYGNKKLNNMEIIDFGTGVAGTILSCTKAFYPPAKIYSYAYRAIAVTNDIVGAGASLNDLAQKCKNTIDPNGPKGSKKSRSLGSLDPNDKIGIGITAKHYITDAAPLSYGIRFENSPTASADAQIVKLVDTLDITKVDLSTFQPSLFYAGNAIGRFSHGEQTWYETIDLRPQKNLFLKVAASLDKTKGVFTAIFSSLDPVTMQPITNPLLGFLPPDVNAPDGQGGIYFSVKLKPNLPNETIINNRAHIYFDNNPPIPTPIWTNRLDIKAPGSSVARLSDTIRTDDNSFMLNWGGTDHGAGMEKYNIYYAIDNGAYQPLMLNTRSTSYKFTGTLNSTYAFYSVAVDSVGNLEQKTSADTKTILSKIVTEDLNNEIRIYPNPNKGSFSIHAKSGLDISKITLFNLQGRPVKISYKQTDNYYYTTVAHLITGGVYILEIHTGEKVIRKKILIIP